MKRNNMLFCCLLISTLLLGNSNLAFAADMNAFTDLLWNSLNEDNKVSLFVRYIDIATGNYESKIVNKNK